MSTLPRAMQARARGAGGGGSVSPPASDGHTFGLAPPSGHCCLTSAALAYSSSLTSLQRTDAFWSRTCRPTKKTRPDIEEREKGEKKEQEEEEKKGEDEEEEEEGEEET